MLAALLTDFGTRDYFVAAVKGTILSIAPAAAIVDITHEIEPQNIREAAFTLASCYLDFPKNTVFTAVVDPGVGSARRSLVIRAAGKFFVCPDNGILTFILAEAGEYEAFELKNSEFFCSRVSSTFHGRDIFAPVTAHLLTGIEPSRFGPRVSDLRVLELGHPARDEDGVVGEVIHIDRFGNLITNLDPGDLPVGFSMEIRGEIVTRYCRFYAEAAPGELFAIIGSTGHAEISVNNGSARDRLGAAVGERVIVRKTPFV